MKLIYAVLILVLGVFIQVSFVQLLGLFLSAPNLLLVLLFLLCYFLPFEKALYLAMIGGILIDLFSSVSFGSTALSALVAVSLSFVLRENLTKSGKIIDYLLNNLVVFFVFYLSLSIVDNFLRSSLSTKSIFGIIDADLAGEILFNVVFGALGFLLIEHYRNKKSHSFYKNVKILS